MDIPIDHVKVFSRGNINLAGIFGTDNANYKGMYDKVEPIVEITTSASKEQRLGISPIYTIRNIN